MRKRAWPLAQIDGNKTNFDRLSAELAVIKHKFSVVALAETNTDECNKVIKTCTSCTPVYSSKIENKVKGSGVALYVKNDFSFNIWNELSSCNKRGGGGGSGTKLQTQGRLYCILDFCKSETHHPVFWYLGTIQFWPKICDTHPNFCLNFIVPTQNYVFYFHGLNKTQNL